MNLPLMGVGLVAALAIAGAGVQTIRLANTETDLANEKAAFSDFKKELAEESLRVVKAAAERSDEQIVKLNEQLADVSIVSAKAKTEIRYVQSNGGPCAADPVYRATVRGVRDILAARGPEGGNGKAQRGPSSVVRRADPAGREQKPQ